MRKAIQLRAAHDGDLEDIVGIWRESMELHGRVDRTFKPRAGSDALFQDFVSDQIVSPDAVVTVAQYGDRSIAYGVCILRTRSDYFEVDRFGLITDLDVLADWHRKGIGEQVLSCLCDWLRGHGVLRVEAEVVSANEIAANFWRKHGFATYFQAMYREIEG